MVSDLSAFQNIIHFIPLFAFVVSCSLLKHCKSDLTTGIALIENLDKAIKAHLKKAFIQVHAVGIYLKFLSEYEKSFTLSCPLPEIPIDTVFLCSANICKFCCSVKETFCKVSNMCLHDCHHTIWLPFRQASLCTAQYEALCYNRQPSISFPFFHL